MNDDPLSSMDPEAKMQYWLYKLPELHKDIRNFREIIPEIKSSIKKTDEIHLCICGPIEEPKKGLAGRVTVLEDWRVASTNRVKSRGALKHSIIGGTVVGTIIMTMKWVFAKIQGGP